MKELRTGCSLLVLTLAAGAAFGQWDSIVHLTRSDSVPEDCNCWMVTRGSYVHAIWLEPRSGHTYHVYRRSTDCGRSWGTITPIAGEWSRTTCFLAYGSGSVLHFVYDSLGTRYRRSTNDGATWSAPTLIDAGDLDLFSASQNGYAFLINARSDSFMLKRSPDNGVTWSSWIPIVRFPDHPCRDEVITDFPPYVIVYLFPVFPHSPSDTVWVARSSNNGATWQTSAPVVTTNISEFFCVADERSRLHLAWIDDHAGNDELYYLRSTDYGATWGSTVRMTVSSGASLYWLGAKEDAVYLTMRNPTTQMNRRRSFDGGATWEPESQWPRGPSVDDPSLVQIGEDPHWIHAVDVAQNGVVYYASKDAGATWAYSYTVSDTDNLDRYPLTIGLCNGDVHVLWEDYETGSYGIYYRRGAGLAGLEEELLAAQEPEPALSLTAVPTLFSQSTVLNYALPTDADVVVTVRDAVGKLVRSLLNGRQRAGRYRLSWDGRDNSRETLPVGCYFCVLQVGGRTSSSKLLLTR